MPMDANRERARRILQELHVLMQQRVESFVKHLEEHPGDVQALTGFHAALFYRSAVAEALQRLGWKAPLTITGVE